MPSTKGAESPGLVNQSFVQVKGRLAGALRQKNHTVSNSIAVDNLQHLVTMGSPMSSICESYKNVDFYAIEEPYRLVKKQKRLQHGGGS